MWFCSNNDYTFTRVIKVDSQPRILTDNFYDAISGYYQAELLPSCCIGNSVPSRFDIHYPSCEHDCFLAGLSDHVFASQTRTI